MTQIIILEGISSSGKSTLQFLLKEFLEIIGNKILIIDEKESIGNLLNKKTCNLKTSLEVLENLIIKNVNKKYDYIIFDRFHISHNGTLKDSTFEDFNNLEKILAKYNAKIIYLNVNETQIINRIRKCLNNRENTNFERFFKENILKKAKNENEENKNIYEFYNKRVKEHLKDIKKTKLKVLKINVSDIFFKEDYNKKLNEITKFIEK